jgi:uncharacterized protein (DUF302 family)
MIYAIKSKKLHTPVIIDYKKNAKRVGKKIPPAVAILITDQRLESDLVSKNPKIGLDLPLKIYIYQKKNGVFVTYHSPLELEENYYIPLKFIKRLDRLLRSITDYATR